MSHFSGVMTNVSLQWHYDWWLTSVVSWLMSHFGGIMSNASLHWCHDLCLSSVVSRLMSHFCVVMAVCTSWKFWWLSSSFDTRGSWGKSGWSRVWIPKDLELPPFFPCWNCMWRVFPFDAGCFQKSVCSVELSSRTHFALLEHPWYIHIQR